MAAAAVSLYLLFALQPWPIAPLCGQPAEAEATTIAAAVALLCKIVAFAGLVSASLQHPLLMCSAA
jgi:hypothetical protein